MFKKKAVNRILSIALSVMMVAAFAVTGTCVSFAKSQDNNELTEAFEYNGEPVVRGVTANIQSKSDPNNCPYLTYYYSDGYFKESPTEYNEHLATMSAMLAVSSNLTDTTGNCTNMLSSIGCTDIEKNSEYGMGGKDTISYVVAHKTLFKGTKDECTLIPIVVRGFFYGKEWCDNFTIGTTGDSRGINNQASKIKNHMSEYIRAKGIDENKVKFLITGYSRGGGVSNVAGKLLSDVYGKENVYAYSIEAQMCADTSGSTSPASYTNLHVEANYNDFVTMVAPTYMNFSHYGTVHTFGQDKGRATDFAKEEQVMLTKLKFINEGTYDRYISPTNFTWAKVKLSTKKIIEILKGETDFYSDIDTSHKQGNSVRDCIEEALNRMHGVAEGKSTGVSAVPNRAAYAETIPSDVSSAAAKIGADRNYTVEDVVCGGIGLSMDLTETQAQQLGDNLADFAKDNVLLVGYIYSYATERKLTVPYNTYPKLVNRIWEAVEEENHCISSVLDAEQTEQLKNMLPIALYTIARYSSVDYDQSRQTMGAIAYNVEDIIIPMHYQDLNVAWIMSEDSYYDDETVRPLTASRQSETSICGLNGDSLQGLTISVKDKDGDEVAKVTDGVVTKLADREIYAKATINNAYFNTPAGSGDEYTFNIEADSSNADTKNVRIGNRSLSATEGKERVIDISGKKCDFSDLELSVGDKLGLFTTGKETTVFSYDLAKADIQMNETEFTFDGEDKTPEVIVKVAGKELSDGKDYSVEYRNNRNAGKATAEIVAEGDTYYGKATKEFTINKAESEIEVSLDEKHAVGDDTIKLGVKKTSRIEADGIGKISFATSNKKIATVGDDGTVKGVKNGNATITISAAGDENHKAATAIVKVIVPIEITKATLKKTSYNYIEDTDQRPEIKNVNGSTKLKEGTDYEVEYQNSEGDPIADGESVDAGTYNVVITGIGNYGGSVTKSYKITRISKAVTAESSSSTIYVGKETAMVEATAPDDAQISYSLDKTSKKYVTLKDNGDGTAEIEPIKAGSAKVTVTAAETTNYKAASKTIKVTVKKPTDISNGKLVTIKAGYNDGKDVEPDVTVKGFKESTDYEVECTNATEIGDEIEVTVKSFKDRGGCTGSFTKTVTVGKGSHEIVVDNQPSAVKVGEQTDEFTITGIKGGIEPTVSTKTYARIIEIREGDEVAGYKIQGVKKGTATITIKTAATDKYNAATLTFKVKVTK